MEDILCGKTLAESEILGPMKSIHEKRLLYVSYVDYENRNELGVIKKIEGQKKAFADAGYHIDHLKIKANTLYVNDDRVFAFKTKPDFWIRLPLEVLKFYRKYPRHFYHIVYIRKTFFSPLYYFIFKRWQRLSRYIFMEIPTFPYHKELQGKWSKIILLMDYLNNILIKTSIYRIVTTQDYPVIMGVDTVRINNGYDFSRLRSITRQREENTIRMISVANFNFWHGIDRLLYGIRNYYDHPGNELRIQLHLVGGGSELESLRQLVVKLSLSDNVKFHGPQSGGMLDRIYDESDVGVGVLGLYRKGLNFTSSLKNMEYCYYGLPFIIGNPDKAITRYSFVLEFPNNDTPVDIQKVAAWFTGLNSSPAEIRNIGKELYSWNKQIRTILDSLR